MHTPLLITLHNNSIAKKQQTSTYCTSPPLHRKSHPPKHLPHPKNPQPHSNEPLQTPGWTPQKHPTTTTQHTAVWPTRKLTSFWGGRVAYFEANSTRRRTNVGWSRRSHEYMWKSVWYRGVSHVTKDARTAHGGGARAHGHESMDEVMTRDVTKCWNVFGKKMTK